MCKVMEESNRRTAMDIYFSLVSENEIAPEVAAKKLKITVDELLSEMQHYGYAVPQKPLNTSQGNL